MIDISIKNDNNLENKQNADDNIIINNLEHEIIKKEKGKLFKAVYILLQKQNLVKVNNNYNPDYLGRT